MTANTKDGVWVSRNVVIIILLAWLLAGKVATSKNRYMRARRKPVLTLHEADKQIFGTQRKAG